MDMPQNELYENHNLGITESNLPGRLTTEEYQICCAPDKKIHPAFIDMPVKTGIQKSFKFLDSGSR